MKAGKKNIFLIFLYFIIGSGSLFAQPIDWEVVKDRYVEKYQPEEIPAWLFPIIFKDGTGARDTIYFGHDENATTIFPSDTIFQEVFIPSDSSVFHAYWGNDCNQCDTFSIADIYI